MTAPDPFAEVRAELVAGLGRRIETMRTALAQLEREFRAEDAEALSRAAHSLTGTAASFGADGLAHVTGDLEDLARGWLDRRTALPEEWRAGAAAPQGVEATPRGDRAAAAPGGSPSSAAPPAGVGEVAALVNAPVGLREDFRGARHEGQRVG